MLAALKAEHLDIVAQQERLQASIDRRKHLEALDAATNEQLEKANI